MAGQSKIRRRVVTSMLPSDNVLHVKRHRWLAVAMQLAVFASEASSFNDGPAQSWVH